MKTQLACIALLGSLFFVSCDKDDSFDELQQIENLDLDLDQIKAIDKDEITEEDAD